MTRTIRAVLTIVGAVFALSSSVGCGALLASSESASDIASSPFVSLSVSSSPDLGYELQVSDLTASHVEAGGDATALMREVGRVAEEFGVTDWEDSDATWRAIGLGLRGAGLTEPEYQEWRDKLTQDPTKSKLLDRGFR